MHPSPLAVGAADRADAAARHDAATPTIESEVVDSAPAFDLDVPTDGYAWWYVDAISDCGRHALTVIAFVGSVFSPYYARARRRGRGDPEEHVAINVGLYGLDGGPSRWTMTERGRRALRRDAGCFTVGPSSLTLSATELLIALNEVAVPVPRRVRGEVSLSLPVLGTERFLLDLAGRHRWHPLAPHARIRVDLHRPRLQWVGDAYFDCNHGDRPLEDDFDAWTWSRALHPDGSTSVSYDVTLRRGAARALARRFAAAGSSTPLPLLPWQVLPRSGWRMTRHTRADTAATIVRHTLIDAPFYVRSLLAGQRYGDTLNTLHESVSLTRLTHPLVQRMLPFRMPRRA